MSKYSQNTTPIIVALDFNSANETLKFIEQLEPTSCRLKVGKELFTSCGPELVKKLVVRNFDVFLDLKFHDIPNTVAQAVKAARDLGVWMVNVHASGGKRMLEAARAALDGKNDPLLIAVTVLTSMEQRDLQDVGIAIPLEDHICNLARLTAATGLDGVVCSAMESAMLSQKFGPEFCLVTPGIRLAGSESGDQRRVMAPRAALDAGSHYLVIGRPITQASNPAEVVRSINDSLI